MAMIPERLTGAVWNSVSHIRHSRDPEAIARAILDELTHGSGRLPAIATRNDWYLAVATTVRDRLHHNWIATLKTAHQQDVRTVGYLSAEFLMGPHLGNNLVNLGILEETRKALAQLGLDLDDILQQEEEPGLGNGGLGRLAACYLDSLATLEIPAVGYGIRYEFGIFDQEIHGGQQVEVTDKWLRLGNPWEIHRPEIIASVGLGGHTEMVRDAAGRLRACWLPARVIKGIAYDTPVAGYRVNTVNLLRLWTAEACESFDFEAFNVGDYYRAVEEKMFSENLTKVLYPNDDPPQGKRLRLEQQYFLVACSLHDMMRIHKMTGGSPATFDKGFAVQMNDTHPSLAVAELMRILVDQEGMEWEPAWETTRRALAYTNHTLLPEALETWPVSLFGSVLPRHLEIIYEINRRFLDDVQRRYPGDLARVQRMSLIGESPEKRVRMAHLAVVGSHAVNGVAALHSQLLTRYVLHDFHEMEPDKFLNVTNGVTPRRWVVFSNPGLASLITEAIGDAWIRRTEDELVRLEPFANDAAFLERWRRVKRDNKIQLAALARERTGVAADPDSLFDVQVKRIHEYKRQHLNVLHIVTLYNRLRRDPGLDFAPRTFIFGGKAAPGYATAKLMIRLIHGVADVVNGDPATRDRLRVMFVPDFNVSLGQRIYPAADLSEQISTAGKEASGTGNMKFSMNGALTIGTLDGANVEIRAAVGHENFFLFGLTADEVRSTREKGYEPRRIYESTPELREALDQIAGGRFSRGDASLFRPLVDSLLYYDPFLLLADYASYVACQKHVGLAYREPAAWDRMSVLNVARVGRFSSDRAIREYAEKIWHVRPVPVHRA